jgi:TP901 family phage tail tape measure protein
MADNSTTYYKFVADLKQLDSLNTKLKEAKVNLSALGKSTMAFSKQSRAIGVMTNKMNQNAAAARRMATATSRVSKRGNRMIAIFKSASIAIASAFAFRAIIGGLRGVITTFAGFESQMAAVLAISGATNKEFQKLKDSALELGKTTVFTATQVGQLQEAYARLGFTANEIIAAQAGTLALAAGTGESLASSAAIAGSTLRAFGIEADQTGRVADIMGASFTNSALNLEKFGQSMKFVAPIARAAGFTIEETAAQMMILADNGLSGSLAGNALKNIFLRLGDANSKLNKHLGRTVQGLPQMIVALREMKAESFGLTEATELLDKRSAPAFLALIENIDGLEQSLDTLNNAEGIISQMAAIRLNTLEGDFTLLKSATEGLGVAIGQIFNISLRNSIEGLTTWIQRLSGSTEAMNRVKVAADLISTAFKIIIARLALLKLVTTFGSMVTGIGAVVTAVRGLTLATGLASISFKSLAVAIASTGFGAFVVLAGTLVGYFMTMSDEMGEVELMTNRMNKAFNTSIAASLLLVEGSEERTAAMRKLKQEHSELLKNYDVEIMKSKELEQLMIVLNSQAELRVRIARQQDIVNGLSQENQNKLRQVRIDKNLLKMAIARKDVDAKAAAEKLEGYEDAEKAILKQRVIADQVELDLLASLKNQLSAKKREEKNWNQFRVDANDTTRINLRNGYLQDLEDFRKLSKSKQKVVLADVEAELASLIQIQDYKAILNEQKQADIDKDVQGSEAAKEAQMAFLSTFTGPDMLKFLGSVNKYRNSGDLLNITIDEMKTSVTSLEAALKKSGESSDLTVFSVHKLQRTKDQFKELFKIQIQNIDDAETREVASIANTRNLQKRKYEDELKLMKANVASLKTQINGNDKNQAKIDKKFLSRNKSKYKVLKELTIEGWEKANASGDAGQKERLRLMTLMLEEENNKIETNNLIQLEIDERHNKAQRNALIKYDEKRNQDVQKKIQALFDLEDTGIINFFKINKEKVENAKKVAKQEQDIAFRKFQAGILSEEAYAARVKEINLKLSDTLNDLQDKRLAKVSEVYGQLSEIVMGFAANQADFAIAQVNRQFEQESIDRENVHRDKIEKAEAAGQDTAAMQEQFNDLMLNQEKVKDEKLAIIKRKMFNLEKANSVAMALINGAVAITKVSSETGIAAIVAAPLMSALIAAQIGMILSKRFIAEKGGIVPSKEKFAQGGMVHGARHSQGGVKFAVGGRVAELEGGEAVINRKSTKMFRKQLSAMNVAGGGIKFEQGGLTPGTNAALDGAKGNWTASDIAALIAGSINSQQVYVSESAITSTQSNVYVQETMSTIF